jgi:DNA-binding transcriptional LysR family regulator
MANVFNLERLRVWAAVAGHGSIAEAARDLHVTASSVSQQIGKLERETGHRLVEPWGRGVRLTHAGRVLAMHADQVMRRVAAAEADLNDLQDEILGPLRLGAVGSALRVLLPDVLVSLTQVYSRLVPSVRDGEVADLLSRLLAGELHLLLLDSWTNRPLSLPTALGIRTLVTENVHIALAATHPLAQHNRIDLGEVADTPWTTCGPGTEPHEALVQALRMRGVEADVRYEVTEYPTQLRLVQAGLAAALVPEMARQFAPPDVCYVDTDPPLEREIKAVWRRADEGPVIRACLRALTDLRPLGGADPPAGDGGPPPEATYSARTFSPPIASDAKPPPGPLPAGDSSAACPSSSR